MEFGLPKILLISLIWIIIAGLASCDDSDCEPGKTYMEYFPGDCKRYYLCQDGQKILGWCGWFHQFDEKSNNCKFDCWFFGKIGLFADFCSVDCDKALDPATPTTAATTITTTPNGSTTHGTQDSTTVTTSTTAPSKNTPKPDHNSAGGLAASPLAALLFALALRAGLG